MALLKLESWKLFVLILLPAIVGATVLLISTYFPDDNVDLLVVSQIFTFIFVGVLVSWMYSLGVYLARLPPNQCCRLSLFKCALIVSTLYRIFIDAYSLWFNGRYHVRVNLEDNLWIIPLHLLATVAALYCFYTDARLLVSAERKQPSGFTDVWQTFGLLLAFPIGLWFVQPRFQKVVASR